MVQNPLIGEKMKYTEDTLYDRLVGQYGFDPGDLDDFFRVNSKRNWLTYINKGETDIDRLADVIEDWLGYINPMDESTAKDILESAGYLIEKNLNELSEEDIDETFEEAKNILMDDYGYSSDSIEAAFEYQHAWISDIKSGTPGEIAEVVADFLDSLSDEELEEIGAL